MTQEIYLLRISWKKALTVKGENINVLFQRRISEVSSGSTAMDPSHTPNGRFVAIINYLLDKLDDSSIIEETRRISREYAIWVSSDEYFHHSSEALLWALQKKLGDAWTTEIRYAWAWFFSTLLKIMRG